VNDCAIYWPHIGALFSRVFGFTPSFDWNDKDGGFHVTHEGRKVGVIWPRV